MNTPEAVTQTTIRLPNALHTSAKIKAATLRITMNELFVSAIHAVVTSPKKSK